MKRCTTKSVNNAVFVGIDFHKRFSVVTLGDASGVVLQQTRLTNDEHEIRKFFLRHSGLTCAIENCRGNEWYIELLKRCGCEVKVSNSYAVRLIADSTKKNDKVDSRILMELLARDYLPVCYQPTREEKLLRERLRWRNKLVCSRTQYKNSAHSVLDKENKGAPLDSMKQRKQLYGSNRLSNERQLRLEKNLDVIEFLEQRLMEEESDLIRIGRGNPDVARLKSIPGIGDVSALMLAAELGDVSRFRTARQIGRYLGLVPRLYATSDTRRLGSITKQGSGLMRRVLVQDAWIAVKTSPVFLQRYSRIMKRRGKKVAIIAIARMIAEIAYRILRDKTTFDEKKMTLGQAVD